MRITALLLALCVGLMPVSLLAAVPVEVDVEDFGANGRDDKADDVGIAAAISAMQTIGGGTVRFAYGTFYTANTITIPANISLEGSGRYTTIIYSQHSSDVIQIQGKRVSIKNLSVRTPTTGSASLDGIEVQAGMHSAILDNVGVFGGTTSSWGIHIDAANDFQIQNCFLGDYGGAGSSNNLTGNGILLDNSDPATNAFNAGDAQIISTKVKPTVANTVGIKIAGPDNSALKINNIDIIGSWVSSSTNSGTVGIYIYNSARIGLFGVDLEGLGTGVKEEGVQNGGVAADSNMYVGVRVLSTTTAYSRSQTAGDVLNTFFGPGNDNFPGAAVLTGSLTLTNFTDGDMIGPKDLWLGLGTTRINDIGGDIQIDDGANTGAIQLIVSGNSPQIQPQETNKIMYLGKASMTVPVTIASQRLRLTKTVAACETPADGDLIYADGTTCNPGSGEGVYARVAGSWAKLN